MVYNRKRNIIRANIYNQELAPDIGPSLEKGPGQPPPPPPPLHALTSTWSPMAAAMELKMRPRLPGHPSNLGYREGSWSVGAAGVIISTSTTERWYIYNNIDAITHKWSPRINWPTPLGPSLGNKRRVLHFNSEIIVWVLGWETCIYINSAGLRRKYRPIPKGIVQQWTRVLFPHGLE